MVSLSDIVGYVFWLFVFFVTLIVLLVTLAAFSRLPVYLKLLFLGLLFLYFQQSELENNFLDSCSNHSTATSCAARGNCDMAEKALAMDFEWSTFRMNKCLGLDPSAVRLLQSYSPSQTWGDGSAACTARLNGIVETITNYTCPAELKGTDVFSTLNAFPLAEVTETTLYPFATDIALQWGWIAAIVASGFLVMRLVSNKPTRV